MDRLSIYLTFFTGPVITSIFLVPLFVFDLIGWGAVGIAAAAGFLLSWPTAYKISRLIKRQDPGFDHTQAEPKAVPDPAAPEV